jgi:hypothetical protein
MFVVPFTFGVGQPLTCRLEVEESKTTITWILTPAAKEVISQAHSAGIYGKDRTLAREPPYMAPSTTPEDYSKVRIIHPHKCAQLMASHGPSVVFSL